MTITNTSKDVDTSAKCNTVVHNQICGDSCNNDN